MPRAPRDSRKSHNPIRFPCNKCEKICLSPVGLKQHQASAHESDARPPRIDSSVLVEENSFCDGLELFFEYYMTLTFNSTAMRF